MAEKEKEKPKDPAPAPAEHGAPAKEKKKGMLTSTPVMIGFVMVLEAVVLFAGFKFLGGGAHSSPAGVEPSAGETAAAGGEGGHDAPNPHGSTKPHAGAGGAGGAGDAKKLAELLVVESEFPNKQTGAQYVYKMTVYVCVKNPSKDKVTASITERAASIKDRIRAIIAASDPAKLNGKEPGLETLRRQIKFGLDELIGEGLIEEVLIPRCIPYQM